MAFQYYRLDVDFALDLPPSRHWLNEQEQRKGVYPDSSKPFGGIKFTEEPKFRFNRGGALRDAHPASAGWLVADRLKLLLERLDPEAFAFQHVDLDYSNFPEPGPDYWLCYFLRELDCVDEERSVIGYQQNIIWKNYLNLFEIKMRPEVVGSAHAFRLKYARQTLIVDDVIVDALKAEKIRGFEFVPLQKG